MTHLIEVAFRGNRKEFFQFDAETAPALSVGIIVEADRGEDYGRVHSTGELAALRCKGCAHGCGTTPPPRSALRLATPDEDARDATLPEENESARRRAMERVKANNLVMKLTDAEWQWDRRKLTFYFTAERRVDFRTLVRDLAAMFRARIELKQIGVRDEAKRLGGIGRCGREYCSASWLPDLRPVNLGVAKDQKLSLNPQQISGACGRLMCCLRYEHEFYVQSRRRFPKEGRIIVTAIGEEKVISCDIFHDRVTLRSAEGDTRVVALADLREQVGGFGDHAHPDHAHGDHAQRDHALSDQMLGDHALSDHAPIDASTAEYRATGAERDEHGDAVLDHRDRAIQVATPIAAQTSARIAAPQAPPAPPTPSIPEPITVVADASPVHDDVAADSGRSDDAKAEPLPLPAASAPAASGDAAPVDGEPRRKRRRGRRGGRRLRAAEQRRQESGGGAEQDRTAASDADADIDDDGDDEVNVAEYDSPPER